MKNGFDFLRLALCMAFSFLFVLSPVSVFAQWTELNVPWSSVTGTLDTIWGTSDSNIYVIGFTGHVFHKGSNGFTEITTEVFGSKSVLLTSDTNNSINDFPKTCIPFGLGGTGPDNVFISGMELDTSLFRESTDSTASANIFEGKPFLMHYDGHYWSKIPLTESDVDSRYIPHSLIGVCGTGPENMYFSGWKVLKETSVVDGKNVDTLTNTGVVLHLNALTGTWTGEVGVGDLVDDPASEVLSEINEITFAGNNDIYAVGLKGLILHKSLYSNKWERMNTPSNSLYFFRVWAYDEDNVVAAGFNNSDYKATIYKLNDGAWTTMALPRPKQGQIPVLWGLWGESEYPNYIFAVGNAGATVYYDGNTGNEWYSMLNVTTTSLNGLWGTSRNSIYACGENGKIYYFDGEIITDAVKAYPMLSVAPQSVEFTDMSPDKGSEWSWKFNDVVSEVQAPTADLDYEIFITGIKDPSLNGNRIVVLHNNSATSPYLAHAEAVSAQVDLGEKLLVTAVPGDSANNISISIQETEPNYPAAIYTYSSAIIVKIPPGTTQGEVASLLESLDIIQSATADSPSASWVVSDTDSGTLAGGEPKTLYVYINSGFNTYQEIADCLVTDSWISTAEADSPNSIWISGNETVSNIAYFSGGLADSNVYVNTNTFIDNYDMSSHTYTVPGDYTVELTVTHPAKPAKGNITIYKKELPVDYDQDMYIEAIPGTSMNGMVVTIADGGDGTTPYIDWNDSAKTMTVYIDSGATYQSDVADLLLRCPYILIASPTYPGKYWHVSDTSTSNSVILYNGSIEREETSYVTVKVLAETPIDFTVNPSKGVSEVTATFKAVPSDIIKGYIISWTWYFDYKSDTNYGSEAEGTVYDTANGDEIITYTYSELGEYNVLLKIVLDDNSPFYVFKENAVTVKSPDEDKSSLEGGSGLADLDLGSTLRGCFISVMQD